MSEWPDPDDYPLYFDRDGNRIDSHTMWRLKSDESYKRVAETTVGDVWVSTVWTGYNYSLSPDMLPPVIFETMAFSEGAMEGALDEFTERYTTLADAQAGHERVVEAVRAEHPTDAGRADDPATSPARRDPEADDAAR